MVITFGGKIKDYRIWGGNMSMALINGCKGAMTGKDKPPGRLVLIDEATKDGKKALRNINEWGYSEILLSVID